MAVCDLIDCGGQAYSVDIVYGTKKESIDLEPEKIKIDLEQVNNLLGLELKEKDLPKILGKMGYIYKKPYVLVPAWRVDIMHPVDIIEDIAIAYGYDRLVPEIPEFNSVASENPKENFKRKIAEILAGLGMLETSSLHLLTHEDIKKAGSKKPIEVEDSKTDYKFLRSEMLASSLKILASNVDAEYPQKIFEIGTVFKPDETAETGIKEASNLVISLAPGNFTEIKQVLEYLGRMLGVSFSIEEAIHSNMIEGRCGKVKINNREVGVLGEIAPGTLKSWHIKMPAASLEINIDELIS